MTSTHPDIKVRPFRKQDFDQLYRANSASTPGVSDETQETLRKWIAMSTCLVATNAGGRAIGFVTLMRLGNAAYASANMRWFERYAQESGKRVIYVDRIALLPECRGLGIGSQLYISAFEHLSEFDEIGCEVNTRPPNPGSHRFHRRLGFKKIGAQEFERHTKSVAYYVRALPSSKSEN